MIKLVASVSFTALALAACAAAAPPPTAVAAEAVPAVAPAIARTPEGARQFVADVEKDLAEFNVIGGRAAWVNATYINDDTDALNAYFA